MEQGTSCRALRAFISEGDCVRIHSQYRVSLCFVVILTANPLVKTAVLDLVLFFLLLMHQLGVISAPGRKVCITCSPAHGLTIYVQMISNCLLKPCGFILVALVDPNLKIKFMCAKKSNIKKDPTLSKDN